MSDLITPQERAGLQMICGDNPGMQAVVEAVAARQPGSLALHARSLDVLSGAPSLAAFESPMLPLAVRRAQGSRIEDVDGNEYIDCHMAYTASVLGHAPAPVQAEVQAAMQRGLGAGQFFEEQVQLAEQVVAMVPGVERVAMFHSGGEAVASAVRLARAATGRMCVAKFEGCYHGANDIGLHNTMMILSGQFPRDPIEQIFPMPATAGVRSLSEDELLVLPFNSPVALDLLRQHAADLACVVVDPVPPFMSNWAEEARDFVRQLCDVAEEAGVPVVFDEVVSGFRLAPGGAAEWLQRTPAMSCFGKITSALGIPLSLVAGAARFLDAARTDGMYRDYRAGKVWVSSTLAAAFPAVVAALAQLRHLHAGHQQVLATLDHNRERLQQRLEGVAQRSGIPVSLQGHARLQMQLAIDKPQAPEHSYRGMMQSTSPKALRQLLALTFYLRLNGVYCKLVPSMNLSAAHSESDVDAIAEAIERSLEQMRRDGMVD